MQVGLQTMMKSEFDCTNFYRKESLIKKAMKCKDLEEDNKKLRKLLKYIN